MRKSILLLLLALSASPAYAQIETCTSFKREIDNLVAGQNRALNLLAVEQNTRCFALFAADVDRLNRAAFENLVKKFESSRTDKQSGGGAGAAGSTSVVAQGPAAKVLSVAAEYGAITQAVNGQVLTVAGNVAGLPAALVRHDIFPYCADGANTDGFCVSKSLLSILRRASFSVSFDASHENQVTAAASNTATTQPATFTFAANKSDISAIGARIELWNSRDATSKGFVEKWKAKVGESMNTASEDLFEDAGNFADEIIGLAGYKAWREKHLALVLKAEKDRAKIIAALTNALRELVAMAQKEDAAFRDHAETALEAYNRFFLAEDELIDSLAKSNVISFEFTNSRPAGQPATSSLRLVADIPLSAQTKFVANGGVTLYDDPGAIATTGATRVRDAQVGVELDQALGKYAVAGPAVLSLAGYYQHQNSAAVLNVDPGNPVPGISFTGLPASAKTIFATPGDIFLGQAKLTLSPPGSAVKIPASITFSNRTELIDKPTWRGQIGITYDFDSLFAGLK